MTECLARTGLRRLNLELRVVTPEEEEEPAPSLPLAPSVTICDAIMAGKLETLGELKEGTAPGMRATCEPKDSFGDDIPRMAANGSENGRNLLLHTKGLGTNPPAEPADGTMPTAMIGALEHKGDLLREDEPAAVAPKSRIELLQSNSFVTVINTLSKVDGYSGRVAYIRTDAYSDNNIIFCRLASILLGCSQLSRSGIQV